MTTLTADQAAEYLKMTVTQFRRAVFRGELPQPIIKSRPHLWSKIQIDWALEGKVDHAPSSGPSSIMERINARHHALRR